MELLLDSLFNGVAIGSVLLVAALGLAIVFAHPFNIRSGSSGTSNFSNTLIHVATNGTISTGASAQGKTSGVLYWQIPHDIVSSGRDSYQYYCSSHASNMKANVNIKDTGAI